MYCYSRYSRCSLPVNFVHYFLLWHFYHSAIFAAVFIAVTFGNCHGNDPTFMTTILYNRLIQIVSRHRRITNEASTTLNSLDPFINVDIHSSSHNYSYSGNRLRIKWMDFYYLYYEYSHLCCISEGRFTPELLEHWGYRVENHTVKTEDGYLLTMHRIPNPNSSYYPIIVQHGILLASDVWVLRGPKEDLVLLLADRGFDVWLANTRGNHYSKKHATHRSIHKHYWDFGWDEVGKHDIPAMISYVQKVTKVPKVIHMGHSMGTTSFYAMLSNKPEMNKNIAAHISLAPVAYMNRMKCLRVLRPITIIINQLIYIQHRLRLYDFFGRDRRISLLISRICNNSKRTKFSCYGIVFLIIGPDFKQLRPEIFDRFIGHFPSGASSTQFLHFTQNVHSKEFREFDYGPTLNIEKYGQSVPPLYNLTKITVPVYLYYSTNDYLSHNLDVDKLAEQLPNVKKKYLVPYKDFNHLDFIFATNSMTLLYGDIIKTLKSFIIPR